MSWPFTVNLSNAKIHWFHMFLIMDLEDGTSLQPKWYVFIRLIKLITLVL